MGKSFGHSDFWHHFGGQALVMIGRWYSRQPLTNLLANPNIACEQALLFGQAKRVSRERPSEGTRLRRSLARSSETRFNRPDGTACSQANPNIPEIVTPNACTHSPYSFWNEEFWFKRRRDSNLSQNLPISETPE